MVHLVHFDISFNEYMTFKPVRNLSYAFQFIRQLRVVNISKVYPTFGFSYELFIEDIKDMKNSTITELYMDSNRLALFETNAAHFFPPNLEKVSVRDNLFTFGNYVFTYGVVFVNTVNQTCN